MFKDESEFKKIVSRLNIDTEPNPKHRQELRRQVLSVFNEAEQRPATRIIVLQILRRTIMKSPITRIAAAAVIIIAVLVGLNQIIGSTPAFADIVRPLLTARTATFKMTINIEGEPGQTFEGMFMGPSRMRHVVPLGNIQIFDWTQRQSITLIPTLKKAMIIEMENIPENQDQNQLNMFQEIRKRIRKAQENENESVKFIGERKIDGVNAIGYRVEDLGMDMTVWADAKTLMPIRIEYSMGEMTGHEGTVIMSDIVFDVELDESLFEVPEGYEVHTMQYDASLPGEEDFIQVLRLWTETTDGKFPSELNTKTIFGEFFKALPEKTGLKFEEGKAPDLSDPKFQKFLEILTKITRGIMFAHTLGEDCDWHYTGKDVKFGDVDTAIFWYRPEGSETYRVIYGDLSVKDVAPENLPK